MNNAELKKHAANIRKNILYMVTQAQSGHPGGSLSAADIVTELYFDIMDINENNVNSIDRDRFVLSKGHASPLMYAVLKEKGLLDDDLASFRKINSNLQGHPNMNEVAGVDMSTGSLGQGISAAVGMALANKLDRNDHRIYTLVGDGESQEGQVWEAAMAAAHYNLNNLCAIVDFNSLQIDGNIEEVMNPVPLDEKFKAFGWNVLVIDGHDYNQLRMAFDAAAKEKRRPTAIIARTIKGKGVSFMENNAGWHGVAPSQEQYEAAVAELENAHE
jgi:transketolase